MLAKIAKLAVAAAAVTFTLVGAEGTAAAAFKAICEHPTGGTCVAIRSSGHIECQCKGETHETTNEDIKGFDDDELLDACWEAYSLYCTERMPESAECSEPDHGSCDVSAGGSADCQCDAIGTVSEENLSELEDLTGDELEDACYEQLDRLCIPPASPAMAPIPTAAPATFGDPGGGSTMGCSVGDAGGAGWALLLLPLVGYLRRRR